MNKNVNQGIFAFILVGIVLITDAKADDSVYINLSVLDNLASAPVSVSTSQGPLFPIVKKAPKVKKKPSKPKIKVVKKTIEKKPELAVKNIKVETVKAEAQSLPAPIPYVESPEKVEVVDVEPVLKKAQVDVAPIVVQKNINAETVSPTTVEPVVSVSEPQVIVPSPSTIEDVPNNASALLIDDNVPSIELEVIGKLTFLPEVDELSSEQQNQIDEIIKSFEDAINNKIAIYAYNLDDGVDTFKRKRLSLNRAVAVRSYLLPKGYKNFSIKVVNVDIASGKANTVELEELKR